MKNRTLLDELRDKKNTFFNEEQSFIMTKIFTSLLFTLFIVFIITALALFIIDGFILINFNLSFNDYLSLCFGNVCFYYCFIFIKEKVVPYYTNNPLFFIGIIYPAFFNASIVQNLLERVGLTVDIKLLITIISVIVYYLILNLYYKKRWFND